MVEFSRKDFEFDLIARLRNRTFGLRERYQDAKIKDFGDKWRIDYWDYTTTPRTKRGKKWSKKYVPTRREAQKLADEFMESITSEQSMTAKCIPPPLAGFHTRRSRVAVPSTTV